MSNGTDPYANLPDPTQQQTQAGATTTQTTDPYANMADPYANGGGAGQTSSWYGQAAQFARDAVEGAKIQSLQIPATLTRYAEKLPVVGAKLKAYEENDPDEQRLMQIAAQKPQGAGQRTGSFMWDLAEFATGEEALKGLSATQKLAKIAPVVKTLETNPRIVELMASHPAVMRALPGAVRGAVVSAGQTLGHGGTGTEALENAALAGSLGVAIGGVGGSLLESQAPKITKAAQEILPDTENIGGREIPRFAAQRDISPDLKTKAIGAAERPDLAAAQQTQAKLAFGDEATRAVQRSFDRFGWQADPVADFTEAADQMGSRANEIYNQVDAATDGQFRQINQRIEDAEDVIHGDVSLKAKNKARVELSRAQDDMNQLFNGFDDGTYGGMTREAAEKAKAIFADHYIVRNIAKGTDKAFDYASERSAAGAGGPGATVERTLNVPGQRRGDLQPILADLEDKYGRPKLDSVLGPQGLDNLNRIARITSDPQKAKAAGNIVGELVNEVGAGATKGAAKGGMTGFLTGLGWKPGATIGSVIGGGAAAKQVLAKRLLQFAATNPRVGKMLEYAVNNNVSQTYAARLMAVAMSHEMNQQRAAREQAAQEQQQQQEDQEQGAQ